MQTKGFSPLWISQSSLAVKFLRYGSKGTDGGLLWISMCCFSRYAIGVHLAELAKPNPGGKIWLWICQQFPDIPGNGDSLFRETSARQYGWISKKLQTTSFCKFCCFISRKYWRLPVLTMVNNFSDQKSQTTHKCVAKITTYVHLCFKSQRTPTFVKKNPNICAHFGLKNATYSHFFLAKIKIYMHFRRKKNDFRPCLSPGGLPFLLAALPRYHILIMPAFEAVLSRRSNSDHSEAWL